MQSNIVLFIRKELQLRAHPENARAMAAYMKTTMPFYGVKVPDQRTIAKRAIREYPILNRSEYANVIHTLWNQTHREEKHIGIDIARLHPHFINFEMVPLFEQMMREGAWWDFVDTISIQLIGTILAKDPIRMWPIIEFWISDECMWIRRAAIICQNKFKKQTDHARLFSFCLQQAHEKEFFIRKAIGWALREYAKSEPQEVRKFLINNRDRFSNFSYREATKSIDKKIR